MSRLKQGNNELSVTIDSELNRISQSFNTLLELSSVCLIYFSFIFIYYFFVTKYTSNEEQIDTGIPEITMASLNSEARALVHSIETLLTTTAKLKETILFNDSTTLVNSIMEEKRELNELTNKSRIMLVEAGKSIQNNLDILKRETLLNQSSLENC